MKPPAKSTRYLIAAVFLVAGASWLFLEQREELTSVRERVHRLEERATTSSKVLVRSTDEMERLTEQLDRANQKVSNLESRARGMQTCGRASQPFPHLTVIPSQAAIGERVSVVGDCFVGPWRDFECCGPYGLFLIREISGGSGASCELIAGGPHELSIEGPGRRAGFLTVPRSGDCFQGGGTRKELSPGLYRVGIGCHACITEETLRITQR